MATTTFAAGREGLATGGTFKLYIIKANTDLSTGYKAIVVGVVRDTDIYTLYYGRRPFLVGGTKVMRSGDEVAPRCAR